jgi:hypothetical protein
VGMYVSVLAPMNTNNQRNSSHHKSAISYHAVCRCGFIASRCELEC